MNFIKNITLIVLACVQLNSAHSMSKVTEAMTRLTMRNRAPLTNLMRYSTTQIASQATQDTKKQTPKNKCDRNEIRRRTFQPIIKYDLTKERPVKLINPFHLKQASFEQATPIQNFKSYSDACRTEALKHYFPFSRLETKPYIKKVHLTLDGPITNLKLNTEETILISTAQNGSWGTTNLESNSSKIQSQHDQLTCSDLSIDGAYHLIGGKNHDLQFYNTATGEHLGSVTGEQGKFLAAGFCQNENACIALEKKAPFNQLILRKWNLESGMPIKKSTIFGEYQNGLFSKDLEKFAGISTIPNVIGNKSLSLIHIWSTKMCNQVGIISAPWLDSTIDCAAFSPNSNEIIFGGNRKTIYLSSSEKIKSFLCLSTTQLKSFTGHRGAITAVAFSPCGNFIVSADNTNEIMIWNKETTENIKAFGAEAKTHVTALEVCRESIFTGHKDGSVIEWVI